MKKNLLSFALLAGLATSTASAEEFYLIKDGKLRDGVEIMKYADPTENPFYEETVAPDGTPAFSVKEQTSMKDTRFYIPEGVDLTRFWNVEIEFYFKDGDIDIESHCGDQKWPVINIGYIADTIGGNDKIDKSFYQQSFDVKFKNKADAWNVERQMIYADPTQTSFKAFVFGWQRQIIDLEKTGPVYIKNLKFYADTNKPFFYEDFNTQAFYKDGFDEVQTWLVYDNDMEEDIFSNNSNIFKNQHSLLPFYCSFAPGAGDGQATVNYRRLFEESGSDGSNYFDTEILQALEILKPNGKKSGRNGRTFLLIPTAGVETAEAFTLDYICKWDASRWATETLENTEPAETRGMKVFYAFVDDAYEASTCEMQPAFAPGDLLNNTWTAYHADIPNNIGVKKYIALIFDKPGEWSYCVDNIRLAATNLTLKTVTTQKHPVGVTSYGTTVKAENINANMLAIVAPVPATDVVTVSNEGVTKVEVVSAAGAVVASANGNQADVSALSTGIYVIKAYTADGILLAKIIKK